MKTKDVLISKTHESQIRFRLEYMRYHRGYYVPITKFLKIIDTVNASSGTILTLKGQIPWRLCIHSYFSLPAIFFFFLSGILQVPSSCWVRFICSSRYISADQTIKERSFWRTSFYEHLKAKHCLSRVTYFVKEKNIDVLLNEAKWFFSPTCLKVEEAFVNPRRKKNIKISEHLSWKNRVELLKGKPNFLLFSVYKSWIT